MAEPVAILSALRAAPRLGVVNAASPVLEAPEFEARHGVKLLIKREDALHPVIGSTKARRLDANFAAALSAGADVMITTGAATSNQTRMIAWLGRRFGFETHAIQLPCDRPRESVNSKEIALFGATSHPISEKERLFAGARARDLAASLSAEGRRPHLVGFGAPEPEGLPGMISLADELIAAPPWTRLLLPVGSAATLHGLETARALGIDAFAGERSVLAVGLEQYSDANRIRRLMAGHRKAAEKALGITIAPLDNAEFCVAAPMIYEQRAERVAYWAREIATLMDPYYHAMALDALVAHIESGAVARGETVLFLMTGGAQDAYTDFASWR